MKNYWGRILAIALLSFVLVGVGVSLLIKLNSYYTIRKSIIFLSNLTYGAILLFPLLGYPILRWFNERWNRRAKRKATEVESMGCLIRGIQVAALFYGLQMIPSLISREIIWVPGEYLSIMVSACFYMLFLARQEQKKRTLEASLMEETIASDHFQDSDIYPSLEGPGLNQDRQGSSPLDKHGRSGQNQKSKEGILTLSFSLASFIMVFEAVQLFSDVLTYTRSDFAVINVLSFLLAFCFPIYAYVLLLKINQLFDFYSYRSLADQHPQTSRQSKEEKKAIKPLYWGILLSSLPLAICTILGLIRGDDTQGMGPLMTIVYWIYLLLFARKSKAINSLYDEYATASRP